LLVRHITYAAKFCYKLLYNYDGKQSTAENAESLYKK